MRKSIPISIGAGIAAATSAYLLLQTSSSLPPGWAAATGQGLVVTMPPDGSIQYTWMSPVPADQDDALAVQTDTGMVFHSSVQIRMTDSGHDVTFAWAGLADINCDGSTGTDADIEAFYQCLSGNCCPSCTADFNGDGDAGTDADIDALWVAIRGG